MSTLESQYKHITDQIDFENLSICWQELLHIIHYLVKGGSTISDIPKIIKKYDESRVDLEFNYDNNSKLYTRKLTLDETYFEYSMLKQRERFDDDYSCHESYIN
jgi:hypothetical protein